MSKFVCNCGNVLSDKEKGTISLIVSSEKYYDELTDKFWGDYNNFAQALDKEFDEVWTCNSCGRKHFFGKHGEAVTYQVEVADAKPR